MGEVGGGTGRVKMTPRKPSFSLTTGQVTKAVLARAPPSRGLICAGKTWLMMEPASQRRREAQTRLRA